MKHPAFHGSAAAALLLCCAPSLAATASASSYVDMSFNRTGLGPGTSCAGSNVAFFECDQVFDAPLLASDIDGVRSAVSFARTTFRPGSTSAVPDGVLSGSAQAYAMPGSLHAGVRVELGGLGYSPGGGVSGYGYAQVEDRIKVRSSTLADGTAVVMTTQMDINGLGRGSMGLQVRGSRPGGVPFLDLVFDDFNRSNSDTTSIEGISGQFTAYVGETLWLDYYLLANTGVGMVMWQPIHVSNGLTASSDYVNSAYLYFGSDDPSVQWIAESGASYRVAAVPEPGTYALMLLGLVATGALAKRRGLRAPS